MGEVPLQCSHPELSANAEWWRNATEGVHGLDKENQQIVSFMARQCLDMMSPANSPFTNPSVIERTRQEGGGNFARGLRFFWDDFDHLLGKKPRDTGEFVVGENLAAMPGKVVFRNDLIELLAYEATTERVQSEPVLFVPAWIMKYYILDLSAHNSLVRYLTEQGFTVFILSWKNPGEEDRHRSLEDNRTLGFEAALNTVSSMVPDTKVHVAGYCLGGTLLAIGAASVAQRQDKRMASLTFFAAQIDFEEAGELTFFINESQIAFLEDLMADQGYLRADQMAGAFQMPRSNDLIWSRVIRHHLLGERTTKNDLMAWNADSTRMPAKMHSEYLRRLFLDNDLSEHRFEANGSIVSTSDIRQPIFTVGTEKDHVSPWKSVFKINALTDTDVTFVLTNRGHNAGVVSEPGHEDRHYRIGLKREGDRFSPPKDWFDRHSEIEGSWWPEWTKWLKAQSGSQAVKAAGRQDALFAEALDDAPGRYVLQH